ncbi:migration and invasion-inhibitory protein isoform X2 [Macrotis lagotis]|uniref:migration and invasion-inhibitory protein isoform X2 n=1 Tax=Macrotis lagotis TaxID=92651 RepID=UPI003D69BE90
MGHRGRAPRPAPPAYFGAAAPPPCLGEEGSGAGPRRGAGMGLSGAGRGRGHGELGGCDFRSCAVSPPAESPDSTFEMPDSEDLNYLREMNLELLRQLRVGQEVIRKSVACAKGSAQPVLKFNKEEKSQSQEVWGSQDEESLVSAEPHSHLNLQPTPSTATCDREASKQEQKNRSQEPDPQSSLSKTSKSASLSEAPPYIQPPSLEPKDCHKPGPRPDPSSLPSSLEVSDLGPTIDSLTFGVQRPFHESLGCSSSIPTAQQSQNFQASQAHPWFGSQTTHPQLCCLTTSSTLPGEQLPYWQQHKNVLIPDESWRMKPYLGYDVIAGLLDTDSPITRKSENYFSELQDFRKANKEECISRYPELDPLDLSSSTRNRQNPDSHQCLHCYRVNQRLFTVPVDLLASCPVCKTPRSQRGPETLDHPAPVRVSVPFSTFLPPHQYPIHRRKSFDSSDTMALPRSSRASDWSWSDPLFSMSQATQFQLSNIAEYYRSGGRCFLRP